MFDMSNAKKCPIGNITNITGYHCAYEHIANNHILVCLICQSKIFQGTWCKDKAFTHVSLCIVQATYNTSRPFVCTSCLHTLWIT